MGGIWDEGGRRGECITMFGVFTFDQVRQVTYLSFIFAAEVWQRFSDPSESF